MKISLAGPSYTAVSVVAAAQQTMNLIPEPVEVPNEATKLTLYGRPGLTQLATLSPAKIRALWGGGGRLFAVYGSNVAEVHQNGTVTPAAQTIAQGTGSPDPAQIFSNGHQLMYVSGGYVYVDNGAGPKQSFFLQTGIGHTLASNTTLVRDSGPNFDSSWTALNIIVAGHIYQISGVANANTIILSYAPPDATGVTWTMPNPPNGTPVTAKSGAFLDGYGIVNAVPVPQTATDPGRNFYISGLNDFTMWDPLNYGVKEGHPDYINSILSDSEELWLFGTETIEIWSNVGDPNFPFQRIAGAMIHQGSVATYAPSSVGLTVCWLAGGAEGETVAWQAQGMQPRRISTLAQESIWSDPGFTVSDAVSYGYSDGGHYYWVINFWAMARTFVYDLTTGLWHERSAWNPSTSQFVQYQPWYHAFLPEWGPSGKHIVGDPSTGILYQMASTFYSDNGATIAYQRAMPHLINEDQYGYHSRIELYCETGTASGAAPSALIDWSDDRGHTFKTPRVLSMGVNSDFTRRLVARRLGKARDRVYRVHIESTSKIALVDAFLEMTQGFA
jgi:hypothetical protein